MWLPCATSSTGYFDQNVSVDAIPDPTILFEQGNGSWILTSGVNCVDEIALIVVTKHQFEHWVVPFCMYLL